MLGFEPEPSDNKISYSDRLLLIGSCFTDHIGTNLAGIKFRSRYNPTGIVFDPLSIARHLHDYVSAKQYGRQELFKQNELWHSWHHHSDFSGIQQQEVVQQINEAIQDASRLLAQSDWLFITLGTAYSYQLKEGALPVANCHKAPKDRFDKKLLGIEEITGTLSAALASVKAMNPALQIVITVSPVKHIRDGVVENNRSKARLTEAAHLLTENVKDCSYFPAYELVTDVLRDYRFYAPDMVHPSEQAVQYVFDIFCKTYFSAGTQQLAHEIRQIISARDHRPLHPGTEAHRQFLNTFAQKTKLMKDKLPMLDWEEEIRYFA